MNKIKVALLGLGKQTSRIKRLTSMKNRVELCVIADQDASSVKTLCDSLPVDCQPEITKPWGLEEACKARDVNALLVCSPQVTVNTIRRTLHNGTSVLCDQPISLNTTAIVACNEVAKASSSIFLYSPIRRYDPTFRALRQHVQSGDVGHVTNIRSSASYGLAPQSRTTGCIFQDCVSNEIDTMCWLLNLAPSAAIATQGDLPFMKMRPQMLTSNMKGEEVVMVTLRFPGGTLANLEIRRSHIAHDQHIEVCGTRGMLYLDPSHPHGTILHSVTLTGTATAVVGGNQEEREEEAFSSSVEHFLRCIEGKTEPNISILDNLQAASIANACKKSHQENLAMHQASHPLQRAEVILNEPQWRETL